MVLNANEYMGSSPPLLPSHEFATMIFDCVPYESPCIGSIYMWCCPILTPILKRLEYISMQKNLKSEN